MNMKIPVGSIERAMPFHDFMIENFCLAVRGKRGSRGAGAGGAGGDSTTFSFPRFPFGFSWRIPRRSPIFLIGHITGPDASMATRDSFLEVNPLLRRNSEAKMRGQPRPLQARDSGKKLLGTSPTRFFLIVSCISSHLSIYLIDFRSPNQHLFLFLPSESFPSLFAHSLQTAFFLRYFQERLNWMELERYGGKSSILVEFTQETHCSQAARPYIANYPSQMEFLSP